MKKLVLATGNLTAPQFESLRYLEDKGYTVKVIVPSIVNSTDRVEHNKHFKPIVVDLGEELTDEVLSSLLDLSSTIYTKELVVDYILNFWSDKEEAPSGHYIDMFAKNLEELIQYLPTNPDMKVINIYPDLNERYNLTSFEDIYAHLNNTIRVILNHPNNLIKHGVAGFAYGDITNSYSVIEFLLHKEFRLMFDYVQIDDLIFMRGISGLTKVIARNKGGNLEVYYERFQTRN